jgi:hypothetical protein
MQNFEEKEVLSIAKNAIERFYSWLELINVKEKESISRIDPYDIEKINILHRSGHKVSDEILGLFCEVLLNNHQYAFSFKEEEREALNYLEKEHFSFA